MVCDGPSFIEPSGDRFRIIAALSGLLLGVRATHWRFSSSPQSTNAASLAVINRKSSSEGHR